MENLAEKFKKFQDMTEAPTPNEIKEIIDLQQQALMNYKGEFEKMRALADAFEAQNKRLNDRHEVYENVLKMAKSFIENDQFEELKPLFEAVKL